MLASGNSDIGACSLCLLSAMQREIPFARSKGIDPDVYDVPFDEAETYLDESAREVLGVYEPRVNAEQVQLEFAQSESDDDSRFTVSMVDAEGDINDEDDDEGDDE